jgi:hypothetical protein
MGMLVVVVLGLVFLAAVIFLANSLRTTSGGGGC